jgi:pimeloyl-ACP methyl ester carboxylesterase
VSSIVTEQGILHYESIGRGQPIILLHGWINSWDVWRDPMIALVKTGNYRVYALDFWGFGYSSRGERTSAASFQISSYVEMVHQFMSALGSRIALVGSPIFGRSLNPFLQLAGNGAIANFIWRYPALLRSIMQLLLAKDSKKVRGMIFRDVQRTTMEAFFRSICDLRATDLRQELGTLALPALGIYGARDNIVNPSNAKLLGEGVANAQIAMMKNSRHFPMVDEAELFIQTLDQFLLSRCDGHDPA